MEVSSWENHLFLWAIYTMAMLNNQIGYPKLKHFSTQTTMLVIIGYHLVIIGYHPKFKVPWFVNSNKHGDYNIIFQWISNPKNPKTDQAHAKPTPAPQRDALAPRWTSAGSALCWLVMNRPRFSSQQQQQHEGSRCSGDLRVPFFIFPCGSLSFCWWKYMAKLVLRWYQQIEKLIESSRLFQQMPDASHHSRTVCSTPMFIRFFRVCLGWSAPLPSQIYIYIG